MRSRGIVEVLHDDGQVTGRERNRGGHQQQQYQRKYKRQCKRAPIANNLSELLTALRENASHVFLSGTQAKACATELQGGTGFSLCAKSTSPPAPPLYPVAGPFPQPQ